MPLNLALFAFSYFVVEAAFHGDCDDTRLVQMSQNLEEEGYLRLLRRYMRIQVRTVMIACCHLLQETADYGVCSLDGRIKNDDKAMSEGDAHWMTRTCLSFGRVR